MSRSGISVFLLMLVLFINTCSVISFQREFRTSKWGALLTLSASRGRRAAHRGKKRKQSTKKSQNKEPNKKHVTISLEDNDSAVLAQVVDDDQWWNEDNPYGAKPWPAALQSANLLSKYKHYIQNKTLVELGCGTGLVSIVAAAMNGAHVVATDVSPLALSLVQEGWKETTRLERSDRIKGTLETRIFDIMSSEPLPIQITEGTQAIVVATAMLYQPQLAQALARRVAQAFEKGAWIIVGDDDTGNIAREFFQAQLESLLGDAILSDDVWTETTVKCPELGWTQKNVRILQLNSPVHDLDE